LLDKNSLPDIDKVALGETPLADFIPISCHFDNSTLLTKTGELLQIIEVTGFGDKLQEGELGSDLRELVREAIKKHIPNYSYSVYIHVIRSRKSHKPGGYIPYGFPTKLNDKWNKINNWGNQLTNTLYITIARQGFIHDTSSLAKHISSLIFPVFKNSIFKKLDDANLELTLTADNIQNHLRKLGAKKLTLTRTNKGYMSEQLMFYYQLIHLDQRRTPLPVKDLSEYLSNVKIDFGFNSLKISSPSSTQHAALYSLKDQVAIPDNLLDTFLQSAMQFVITQSLYFVGAKEVKPKFQEYLEYYKINKSEEIADLTGITDMINSDTGKPSDYCKQQTTVLVHSDDEKIFNMRSTDAIETFQEIGLVAVQEDFNLPRLFWSQLPGNFKYLSRLEYLPTSKIGLFSNIHSKKSGNFRGSKWGPTVTIIRKSNGSPFYFNFHNKENNGSTIFVGPSGSGKTILMRFFLCQATRTAPRIIYVDVEGQSKQFVKSIGGNYINLNEGADSPFKINPFSPENFDGDLDRFKDWLIDAIYPEGEHSESAQELFGVIAQKLAQTVEGDKLEELRQIISNSNDAKLQEGFDKFLGSDTFKNLFTSKEENLEFFDSENIIGINISELVGNKRVLRSYLGILLKKIEKCLDNKPTIIALNRAFHAYDIPSFSRLFGAWLDSLNQKNAIALVSTPKITSKKIITDFKDDIKKYGTQLYLSDKFADKNFKKFFGLTESELHKVKSYSVDRRMFLLKQDDLSIMLTLKLDALEDELQTLKS